MTTPAPSLPPPTPHRLLRFFAFTHLPEKLQAISQPFSALANAIVAMPSNDPAETTVALRKLLEAKDCAVRAALPA